MVGRWADLVTVHRRGPVKLLPRSSPQTLLANRGKRPPALTYSGVESSQTQEDMRSTSNAVLPAFWKFVSSLFVPSRNINTSSIMAHFHRQQCNQAQVENMWRCHSHWGSRYRYQPAVFFLLSFLTRPVLGWAPMVHPRLGIGSFTFRLGHAGPREPPDFRKSHTCTNTDSRPTQLKYPAAPQYLGYTAQLVTFDAKVSAPVRHQFV